jgi:SAM-dependent methyltransferase
VGGVEALRDRQQAVVEPAGVEPGYRLRAEGRTGAEDDRLAMLETLFDPASRQLRSIVAPGWRCLEVGAGRGSMARWLAEQVGPGGEVVAIDIDTRYLDQHGLSNLRVMRHDILADPVADLGEFDLVCSRLLLFWLAGRAQEAVDRMASCLRPGGWLVDEDGDWGSVEPVDPAHPTTAAHQAAWRDGRWWSDLGYNPQFGRTLSVMFERAGLRDIEHRASSSVVAGGSDWGRWWADSVETIAAQSPGASPDLVGAVCAPFRDPTARVMSVLLHSCRGRRPGL